MSKRRRDGTDDNEQNINKYNDVTVNNPNNNSNNNSNNKPTIKLIIKKKSKIDFRNLEIKTLDDLIDLANKYNSNNEYTFNLEKLHSLLPSLIKLKNIIGMTTVKDSLVGQIIFFLNEFDTNTDMMHTVIQGPPGVGKTLLGKIIGELYYYMGIIKPKSKNSKRRAVTLDELDDELEEYMNAIRNVGKRQRSNSEADKEPFIFKIVKRSDLIAGYLGQSALKTQKLLDEVEGGVLFIDEAYAFGDDSFSRECMDILCESMSDHKDDLMVIIAGYETELNETFLKLNSGMESRFIWRFKIDSYSPKELKLIFEKQVLDNGWEFSEEYVIPEVWFIKNKDHFLHFGRDMEILFSYIKISHALRIFGKDISLKRKITEMDVENGLKTFLQNKKTKKTEYLHAMYV